MQLVWKNIYLQSRWVSGRWNPTVKIHTISRFPHKTRSFIFVNFMYLHKTFKIVTDRFLFVVMRGSIGFPVFSWLILKSAHLQSCHETTPAHTNIRLPAFIKKWKIIQLSSIQPHLCPRGCFLFNLFFLLKGRSIISITSNKFANFSVSKRKQCSWKMKMEKYF